MKFKLWLEEILERDIVQKIVLDAADVSGKEALTNPIKPHRGSLQKILTRGVIKPHRGRVENFIDKADNETLNDLINFIVQISSQPVEED